MKKFVSLSLVALLLVALCATGAFASSISDYPDLGVTFSQVVDRGIFLKVPYSSLLGSSITNPVELFNGIVAYLNGNYVKIGFDGVYTSNYSFTSGYLYFWCNSAGVNSINYVKSDSDLPFGSQYAYTANIIYFESSNTYLRPYDVGITYGSSFDTAVDIIGESVNFSVPSGYALVVGSTSGDVEIIGRSYSIQNSWSFSTLELDSPFRCNGSVQRVLALGNIRDGFSPDLNGSSAILVPWSAINSNALGTASSYSFYGEDDILLSSGSCFVITNPVYYGTGTLQNQIIRENAVDLNVNLQLQYSTRPSIRLVALESLVNITDNLFFSYYSVFRPEVYDEIGTPSVDGDTTIEVFPSAPSGGGNSGQPPLDDDSTIIGVIQRFTSRVRELFISVSSAIQTLFSSGSTFMQRLADIFSWIPEPVSVVLVSALIVVVVVGLFKIFL